MQKGFSLIVVLVIVLALVIGIGSGVSLFKNKGNKNSLSNTPTPVTNSSISPSPSKVATQSSTLFDWQIWATNVELLVSNSQGQQTGFTLPNGKTINDIPNSSYGMVGAITDPTGQRPPSPSGNHFEMNNPPDGAYIIQEIPVIPGKYTLHLQFGSGRGPDSKFWKQSVTGTLLENQIDKYSVKLPEGSVQKVEK